MSELGGFFTLRTPSDLLDKLEADFNRLQSADAVSKEAQYAAYDFFVTANHIVDWLSMFSGDRKAQLRTYKDGTLVSHIANGVKHFRVDVNRHRVVSDTEVHKGSFQANAFQNDAFDVPRLLIELEDGTSIGVLDVGARVLEHWRRIISLCCVQCVPSNTTFSEWPLETAQKCVFLIKIDTFCPFSVQPEGRSLVENDRPPSL
jgi:hypothetical protein